MDRVERGDGEGEWLVGRLCLCVRASMVKKKDARSRQRTICHARAAKRATGQVWSRGVATTVRRVRRRRAMARDGPAAAGGGAPASSANAGTGGGRGCAFDGAGAAAFACKRTAADQRQGTRAEAAAAAHGWASSKALGASSRCGRSASEPPPRARHQQQQQQRRAAGGAHSQKKKAHSIRLAPAGRRRRGHGGGCAATLAPRHHAWNRLRRVRPRVAHPAPMWCHGQAVLSLRLGPTHDKCVHQGAHEVWRRHVLSLRVPPIHGQMRGRLMRDAKTTSEPEQKHG